MSPKLLCLFGLLFSLVQSQQAAFGLYSLTHGHPNQLTILSGASNGQVTFVKQIDTGGNGLAPGGPGLGSQHSIIVQGNYIFSVNPDSNTVSMFVINPSDPTNVTLLNTAPSGGDYPLSVGASTQQNLVAMVNSGANNSIQLFSYNSSGITALPDTYRSLNLSLTTPPAFHKGPAQVSFTPDGSGVVVSNKGANPPVFLFTLSNQELSTTSATSAISGTVPFSFAFDTDGTIFLVDASPTGGTGGVQLLTVTTTPASAAVSFVLPQYFPLPDNAACWVERSQPGLFWVVNAGTANVTSVTRSGTTLTVNGDTPTNIPAGATDITIGTVGQSQFAFVQGNGTVSVLSLSGTSATVVQTTSLHPTGLYNNGIAVFAAAAQPSTTGSAPATTGSAPTTTGSATTSSKSSTTTTTSSGTSVTGSFLAALLLLFVCLFL